MNPPYFIIKQLSGLSIPDIPSFNLAIYEKGKKRKLERKPQKANEANTCKSWNVKSLKEI